MRALCVRERAQKILIHDSSADSKLERKIFEEKKNIFVKGITARNKRRYVPRTLDKKKPRDDDDGDDGQNGKT